MKYLISLLLTGGLANVHAQNVGIGVTNPANKLQIGSVGAPGFQWQ